MSETVLQLKDSITFGSREIKELTFRELRAKDMRAFKAQMSLGDFLDVAGALAGEPRSVIDMLSARDAMAVTEHVGNYLTVGGSTQ